LLVFALGIASDAVFAFLTRAWQQLFAGLGLGSVLQRAQQGTSTEVTQRSLPAVFTYAALYLVLCLALLRIVLRRAALWWQAVRAYAAVTALIVLLLLVGKLSGNAVLPLKVARRLIDFLVSPLPVVLLVALLASPRRQAAS